METINEDIFESQHNSSAKKTRNNEDLEIIKNPRLANKKSFSDFNWMPNFTHERDLSISVTSVRNKARKNMSKTKRTLPGNYSKLIQGLQSNTSTSKVLFNKGKIDTNKSKWKTNNLIVFKQSLKTTRAYQSQRNKTRKKSNKSKTSVKPTPVKSFCLTTDNVKEVNHPSGKSQKTMGKTPYERKKSYYSLLKKYKHRNNSVTCNFKTNGNSGSKFIFEEKSFLSQERDKDKLDRTNFGSFTCRNLHNSTLSRDKQIEKTMDEYVRMKQMLDTNECTFKPKLNNVSRKISKKRKQSVSSKRSASGQRSRDEIFNRLYEGSSAHTKKVDAYTQKKIQKALVNKPILKTSKSISSKEFEAKKNMYLRKFEKHRNNHWRSNLNIDKSTTQKPFVPKINKSRSGTRSRSRSNGKNIHEHLYNDAKVKYQKKYNEKCKKMFSDKNKQYLKFLSKKPSNYSIISKKAKLKKPIQEMGIRPKEWASRQKLAMNSDLQASRSEAHISKLIRPSPSYLSYTYRPAFPHRAGAIHKKSKIGNLV